MMNSGFLDFAVNIPKLEHFEGVGFRRWQKKMKFLLAALNVAYVLSTPKPIRQHGMNMDDSIAIASIIDKLPPSWKKVHRSLMQRKEEITMEQLGAHLYVEEGIRQKESKNKGGARDTRASGSAINLFKKNGKGKGKAYVKCWVCNDPHFKKDCEVWKKRKAQMEGKSSGDHGQTDDSWWVDTGATRHVCKDINLYKVYKSLENGPSLRTLYEHASQVGGIGRKLHDYLHKHESKSCEIDRKLQPEIHMRANDNGQDKKKPVFKTMGKVESQRSVFNRLGPNPKAPKRKSIHDRLGVVQDVKSSASHPVEVGSSKRLRSMIPSRMRRETNIHISCGEVLKVQPRIIVHTRVQKGENEESVDSNDDPIFISTFFSNEDEEIYVTLLKEYIDVFAWTYKEMPSLDLKVVVHHLVMKKVCCLVKQAQQRFRPELIPSIEGEDNKLIEDLNVACPKDDFSLPITKLVIDAVTGHEIMSFMDGSSRYNKIRMAPEDEELMAFRTPKGIYCYKVMPFGLKNAGATYRRAMQIIFDDMLHKMVECYVDDLVVKSKRHTDHLGHLRKVFDYLRKFQLKMNPLICAFGVAAGKTEESSPPALLLRLWQWSSRREDSTATVAWFAGVVKRGIGTRLHSTELPLPPQSSATAAIRVRRRGNLRCRAPPLSTVAPTRRRKSRRFYPPPCTAKKQGRRQLPLEWDVRELPSPSRTAAAATS
nr:uncharacterized protein LOC109150426 [Ipomoea trifida]